MFYLLSILSLFLLIYLFSYSFRYLLIFIPFLTVLLTNSQKNSLKKFFDNKLKKIRYKKINELELSKGIILADQKNKCFKCNQLIDFNSYPYIKNNRLNLLCQNCYLIKE